MPVIVSNLILFLTLYQTVGAYARGPSPQQSGQGTMPVSQPYDRPPSEPHGPPQSRQPPPPQAAGQPPSQQYTQPSSPDVSYVKMVSFKKFVGSLKEFRSPEK